MSCSAVLLKARAVSIIYLFYFLQGVTIHADVDEDGISIISDSELAAGFE